MVKRLPLSRATRQLKYLLASDGISLKVLVSKLFPSWVDSTEARKS